MHKQSKLLDKNNVTGKEREQEQIEGKQTESIKKVMKVKPIRMKEGETYFEGILISICLETEVEKILKKILSLI